MGTLENSKLHSWKPPTEVPAHLITPNDSNAFLTLVSDSLRLRDETLTMAFVYINKYHHYLNKEGEAENLLDDHTLALASLSLATKGTESPRRLREFLLPAYELLNPMGSPLVFPSVLYDSLRLTLVDAELLLLRILKFDIRLTLPYEYLPRVLEKILSPNGTDHFDFLEIDDKEEIAAVNIKDTSLGRAVWVLVGEAMKSYDLVNFFSARTVALACVYFCLEERRITVQADKAAWLKTLTGDKVYYGNFLDAVNELRKMQSTESDLSAQLYNKSPTNILPDPMYI
ncbi:hypothetical protein EDC01DRAFT_612759 [Geopyxis carbonaria]|nr:hypothetical protein EDC01DRAFT_612759 [Geopyxis carbonaria]